MQRSHRPSGFLQATIQVKTPKPGRAFQSGLAFFEPPGSGTIFNGTLFAPEVCLGLR